MNVMTSGWRLGWILIVFLVLACGARDAVPGDPVSFRGSVEVYVFWREGCPHCERELAWLEELEASQGAGLRVHRLEIGSDPAWREALFDVVRDYRLDRAAVPLTIVGDNAFVGFLDAASSGKQIEAAILDCRITQCADRIAPRLRREPVSPPSTVRPEPSAIEAEPPPPPPVADTGRRPATHPVPTRVRIPIVGEVDTAGVSLAALTVMLAAADGFNPCAMWTLVFLLGLIGNMQDRLRMWSLGIAFVAASAAVYFLFMAAWLNVVLVLGLVVWLRWVVGALAIAGGIYSLKRGFSNEPLVCEVTAPAGRRKVLDALRSLALERRFLLALVGIVLIAVAVNVVELICSAGIPAVYTQVLALSEMTRLQYYGYLVLYVTVFMLDDVVVLVATLGAITLVGGSERYTRRSNRVGGIILLGLGLLLILRPEILVLN